MPQPSPDHLNFIRAVRRKLAFVRAAECLGMAVFAGCLLAVPVVALQQWRGISPWPLLILGAGLCVLAAAALTIHRWPTLRHGAIEADRQFDLSDLLTTALRQHDDAEPAPDLMTAAVLAMADARCGELSPADVVLNRLGARAWGGIGLSVALVLTLAVIPVRPSRSEAADDAAGRLIAATQTPQRDADKNSSASVPAKDRSTRSADGTTGDDAIRPSTAGDSAVDRSDHRPPGSGAGGGTAEAITAPAPGREMHAMDANSSKPSNATNGEPGGAGAGTVPFAHGGQSPAAGQAGAPDVNILSWRGSDGGPSHDGEAPVIEATPPAYRDLVREYFKP